MIMQADAQTPAQPRRRIGRALCVVILLAVIALALAFVTLWHFMLPDHPNARSSPKSVPLSLTHRDVSAISSLCRRHTFHFAIAKLRSAEFRWFWRSSRVLFQQKIDRLFDDGDGTFRAYVVVYDKNESDGFSAWSRHQMTKTNGHWVILRSY